MRLKRRNGDAAVAARRRRRPFGRPAATLDGTWALARTSGLLPPLGLLRKTIAGGRGRTNLGRLPGPGFDVRGHELRYRAPFRALVDVVTPVGSDAFDGRATVLGRTVGRFRMRRVEPRPGRRT